MDIFVLLMTCSLYPDNAITNAMVQLGSREKALAVTTVSAEGVRNTKSTFVNAKQAANYAHEAINKGEEVEVGFMQLPYKWLSDYQGRATLEDLFRPCKNVVIASDVLNTATRQCEAQDEDNPECALSVYKTGDPEKGRAYADTIVKYAAQYPMKNNPQNAALKPSAPELSEPTFGEGENE